jgi:hypothetical protein
VHRGSRTEGEDVTFINTDGMSFIGPGSEWFWTAVSGIVLAVTFIAIYRQLSLAKGGNAFTQLNALVEEWEGERLVRKRVAVLVAIRNGVTFAALPDAAAMALANYWEKVGSLARAGHVAPSLVAEGLGGADRWWGILAPWVLRMRIEDANHDLYEHFEWIAATLVRLHPALAFDQEYVYRTLDDRIAVVEADLRDMEAMRTVTASVPPTTGHRTG